LTAPRSINLYGVADDDEVGYVLHNLVTGEDYSTFTEAEARVLTLNFGENEDWSLWRVQRYGRGASSMVAAGCGPVQPR
jgi:hypothetical protein